MCSCCSCFFNRHKSFISCKTPLPSKEEEFLNKFYLIKMGDLFPYAQIFSLHPPVLCLPILRVTFIVYYTDQTTFYEVPRVMLMS